MKSKLVYFLLSFFVVVADQLSKWAVSEWIIRKNLGESFGSPLGLTEWIVDAPSRLPYFDVKIFSFFNIVMVWNQGVSFGLFNKDTDYGAILLIVFSLLISLWFVYWIFKTDNKPQLIGSGLVIGGAIGNVIDRARFGAVIDFLDFHVFGYHWPAFNIADSAIVVGVLTLIIWGMFFEKSFS